MDLVLKKNKNQAINAVLTISGSKSESNRLLILQQLYPNLTIENLSNSDDTQVMQQILSTLSDVADVHHAGTAMRFLTAFFASNEGNEITLQGSERMHNRPIKILVDALCNLGADIAYLEKEGYPPLKIKGKTITKNKLQIQGNVSSQYISALMLLAPKLKNGLEIELIGKVTSVPYIKMTLGLLNQLGITTKFESNIIKVNYQSKIDNQTVVVESDWSSASYWYSFVALAEAGSKITLTSYKKDSLQGDSCLAEIYQQFGVVTTFLDNKIILQKMASRTESREETFNIKPINLHLKNAPDIAQTIAVTCFGLGLECNLEGLHTLKIKETDRLEALREEFTKLGADITVTNETLHLKSSKKINENVSIATYNDHRMAMAFAPLVLKVPITILNAEVVSKSYPNFWEDCKQIGVVADINN